MEKISTGWWGRCVLAGAALVVSAACSAVSVQETPPGPTVTYNPWASLSPTPFLPEVAGAGSSTPTWFIPSSTQPPENTSTTPESALSRPEYEVEAWLSAGRDSLRVEERIWYPNMTGTKLESLVLVVEPNLWPECFWLEELSGEGVSGYSLESNRLEVRLAAGLDDGDTIEIHLEFTLALPVADEEHLFGRRNGQIALVDWYPFVAPYRGGWLVHPPGEVGEHVVYDLADHQIRMASMDAGQSLMVVAGGPVTDGMFELEAARTAAVSILEGMEMADTITRGVRVVSYYRPADEVQGRRVLAEVSRALEVFEDLFGKYPYESLSIIEADYYDGMEYDGLFYLSRDFYLADDGTKLNTLVAIGVHETAHQWWFGRVGNDQALEPWLDEALSTYGEFLFYETLYPGVAEAWWPFRMNGGTPAGAVNGTIYESEDFQAYSQAVYLRGALFLRDLRLLAGDEDFFAFLKVYGERMAGEIATGEDFLRIFNETAGVELSPLIGEYFNP